MTRFTYLLAFMFLTFMVIAVSSTSYANEDHAYEQKLAQLSQDQTQPIELRVEAVIALQSFDGPNTLIAVGRASRDTQAPLRIAAIRAASHWSLAGRWDLISPLLLDNDVNVQREAIHTLVQEWARLPSAFQSQLNDAIKVYKQKSATTHSDKLEQAWLDQMTGKLDESYSALLVLNKEQPSVEGRVLMAKLYALKGDTARAEQEYKLGVSEFPKSALLHYQLGKSEHRNKNYDSASVHLAKAYQLEPNRASYGYAFALSIRDNEPEKAAQILDEIYRYAFDPTHLYAKCDVLLSNGSDAKACIEELKSVAPSYVVDQLTSQYGIEQL